MPWLLCVAGGVGVLKLSHRNHFQTEEIKFFHKLTGEFIDTFASKRIFRSHCGK